MTILVMADLEMLVFSEEQPYAYYEFVERFYEFLDKCDWVENNDNAKLLFSDYFLKELTNVFPWSGTPQGKTDIWNIFYPWLERARAQKPSIQLVTLEDLLEFELNPNIYGGYVEQDYPNLLLLWLNVLATNMDFQPNQTLIFSFEDKRKPNQVALIHPSDQSPQTFSLIKNQEQWQAALRESDLWLKHQLPKGGDHPYVPAASYRPGDKDFPRQFYPPRRAVAFKDNQGRLWVPDTERGERHWDVQCRKRGRGRYFKVTPDGRLFGDHAPC